MEGQRNKLYAKDGNPEHAFATKQKGKGRQTFAQQGSRR
jgi:hypothetical protein